MVLLVQPIRTAEHVRTISGHSLGALLLGDDVVGDGVDHLLNVAHFDRARLVGDLVEDVLRAEGDLFLRAHAPQHFRVELCMCVCVCVHMCAVETQDRG